jgi:hypothetical protein
MKKGDFLPRFRCPACYLLIYNKKPINNIQTYYQNYSPLIKIYNFKTIQLCPKTVINQHTPLNKINFQSNYYPLWAKQLFITNAYIG